MKAQNSKSKDQNRSKIQSFKNFWVLILFVGICFGSLILTFGFPASALNNPEAKLTEVIENYVESAYPQWIGLRIKVNYKFADKLFDSLRDLEAGTQFKIVDVYRDFRPVGNVIFPMEVTGEGVNRKIFVRAKVEVFKPVVIAKKTIVRGSAITSAELGLEERDIAMLPEKYFNNTLLVAHTEAKTTIPENSTILEWMIKEIPLVHKGDAVSILVKGENLLVKAEGQVLADGYLGKEVKVKGADSKKVLEGVLISSKEVEVTL